MAESLKKSLGLPLLILYGIGIMVGAGIYVLVGHAAGAAGVWAPLAFLLAGLVAVPSALSYAALSAAIPEAAGDSAYVEKGLGQHWLAMLVGWINIVAGVIGGAAVLKGGVGYLAAFLPVDSRWAILGLGILLTLIAMRGAVQSLAFAGVMTLIEVGGLALVTWAGFSAAPVAAWADPPPPEIPGILAASIFAFFAFLGFDDLVNMAEEARNPRRDMPRAILIALGVTAMLYALVTLASVRAVPAEGLAASEQPLVLVWQAGTGRSAGFLSIIAVAAALNGVMAQIVMSARVLYGLGRRAPSLMVFHRSHKRFGTPILATALAGLGTVAAALALPVSTLAEYTTLALLMVFLIVNAALIGVLRMRLEMPFRVPALVPWLGILGSLALAAANFSELLP